MRGGRTATEAAGVNPATANSLSVSGSSWPPASMPLAIGSSTRFTTNSPVRRIFFTVSFNWPSLRRLKLSRTSGGSSATTLKNEKGAALCTPLALTVETSAMGRG